MRIALADAVAAVRDELMQAAASRPDNGMVFTVGDVQLEFEVQLRRDATVQSGFKAWVVAGAATGTLGRTRAHRVSVTLSPHAAGRGPVLVGGDEQRPEGPGDVSGVLGR